MDGRKWQECESDMCRKAVPAGCFRPRMFARNCEFMLKKRSGSESRIANLDSDGCDAISHVRAC